MVVVDKREKSCQIIDIQISDDGRVRGLSRMKRLKNTKTLLEKSEGCGGRGGVRAKVVPVVIGALGTVPLRLKVSMKALGVDTSISLIKK